MMSACVRRSLAWMGAVLLASCHAVFVDEPVGPMPIEPLKPEVWAGHWLVNQSPVRLMVADAPAGRLTVAGIDEQDGRLKLNELTVHLRPWANGWLVTVENTDAPSSDTQRLTFGGWMKPHGDQWLLWGVDVNQFAQAIDAQRLPGRREGDNVRLGALEPRHLDLITSPVAGLLNWREPAVLKRLTP